MPHFTEFNSKPPFPNDVSVAKLECVSLANLRTGGRKESEALFRACKNDGFLFLDLRGDKQGETVLNEASKPFDMGKSLFELAYESKMEFVMGGARSVIGASAHCGVNYVPWPRCTLWL